MRIISTFFLIIISSIITFAQTPDISWKVSVPEFIEENHPFTFSVFALFQELRSDSIVVSVKDNEIELGDSVKILFSASNVSLGMEAKSDARYFSITEDLIQKIDGDPFQIIFNAEHPAESEINFSVDFFYGGELEYSVNSTEVNDDGNYLSPAVIRVYDNFNLGKSLQIKSKGSFTIPVDIEFPAQAKISFWVNSSHFPSSAVNFFGASSYDTLLSIGNDNHNFPILKPDDNTDYLENIYLADSLWNFYEVSFDNGEITLSVNEEKVAEQKRFVFPNEIKSITFTNISEVDIFLSGIKFSAKRGVSRLENSGDSLLKEINFDNFQIVDSLTRKGYLVTNGKLIEKDIPQLAFPPKIDISISSAYSTIEWYNEKDLKIEKYVLQKSVDYNGFEDIYSVENPVPQEHYSYQSYNDDEDKVSFFRVKQIDEGGNVYYSSQVKVGHTKIEDFELQQNYPNPFNPTTSFTVNVIIPGYYLVGIYDLVGKEIQILHNGTLNTGVHTFSFNGEDLPSGIYLLKVKSNNMSIVRKMILAK